VRSAGADVNNIGGLESAVDSAINGERPFAPACGPNEDILSSDNMVVE